MTANQPLADADHFAERAAELARSHRRAETRDPLPVYRSLNALPSWLERLRRYCRDPASEHTRAADWLLDNDYQVTRAIRQIERDLPPQFYDRLDHVACQGGSSAPRIFAIAHAALSEIGMRLSADKLTGFLEGYQRAVPLTIAELWAFPSMLRMAAIELVASGFSELEPTLAPPFLPSAPAQQATADPPTSRIARAIVALQAIHSIEWPDIVERTSRVERVLADDPANVYHRMDRDTRNRYRQTVEEIARGAKIAEPALAQRLVERARACDRADPGHHVGYWLVDAGRADFEEAVGYRPTTAIRLRRIFRRNAGRSYALALVLISAAALAVPLAYLASIGAGPLAMAGGVALTFLPATVLGVAIINWLATLVASPRLLPMMDFRKGIDGDCPTAIVVPVIIKTIAEVDPIISKLEIRYLANPDPMLRFVVLSDFADALADQADGDAAIVDLLTRSIDALNARHGDRGHRPFALLHRRRRFDAAQACWMGWERKRGKIAQFNRLITDGEQGDFAVQAGDIDALHRTRFVITLDADTSLPRDTAARLVGAFAHPLNRARFDPDTGRVLSGYTVIQPRVEILAEDRPPSLFCRFYSGDTAIDIYSRAVSDVYQDLFGSGVFVGKGIYEVEPFRQSLRGKIPEDAILSHDLLEGLHGRTALASNIVLYESFPDTYPEYAMRLHRWIRGDWQLLPWLWGGPRKSGSAPVRLSALDRWKIIDNLRRSLVAPSLLLLFVSGWLVLPGSAFVWTILALLAPAAYLLGAVFSTFAADIRRRLFGDLIHDLVERGGRWFLAIAFLVSDTMIALDAIGRTLWRVLVSRKNLLEWRSAAHVASGYRHRPPREAAWRLMWPSSAVSALVGLNMAIYDPTALGAAAPVLVLWFLSPDIAAWLGRPRSTRREVLDARERAFLARIARRTWLFFETFAGPDDNWLPPDNYQPEPENGIAHRTSPTNIGLYLTSSLAAGDLGFVPPSDVAARLRNALDTMDRMERYRGHILNWYDTGSLEPLEPRYVSTVDNGNLAVCLLVAAQGCRELAAGPLVPARLWEGLACTFDVLMEALEPLSAAEGALAHRAEAIRTAIGSASADVMHWRTALDELMTTAWADFEEAVASHLAQADSLTHDELTAIQVWLERCGHHMRVMARDMDMAMPWLALLPKAPDRAVAIIDKLTMLAGRPDGAATTAQIDDVLGPVIEDASRNVDEETRPWLDDLRQALDRGRAADETVRADLNTLAERCRAMALGMDFGFLYDPEARLFRIGYNVSTGMADANHYDLLATEARLASFLAIAKHDVPLEHWYFLGRPLTRLRGQPSILSWNGSMFEYLMPPLFLPRQRDALLAESEATAVQYQRDYARAQGVPWGISESAFGVTDADGNYQYRAFGAPGLGLRRGLGEDLVIAPYASALALCCWPEAAVDNLKQLRKAGAEGLYGFFDALDFTPGRAPGDGRGQPVRTFMAHHHGMTIGAIVNALRDDVMVERFMSDRMMQTVSLLLHERVPWEIAPEEGRIEEEWQAAPVERSGPALFPWIPSPEATVPEMQLLGNGAMTTTISEAGGGGLSWRGNALTRWRPDPSRDSHGYWFYVRDRARDATWSLGRLPTGARSDDARVVFHQHMAEFFRRDHLIAARMEVTVPPEDDVDIRTITLVNEGDQPRDIELTSYAEIVLAPPLDDERHPAFSKLFVKSSFDADEQALIFERRPRRPEHRPPVVLHTLVADDPDISLAGFETDRARFIGRNRDTGRPVMLDRALSRTTGFTLDPVMALRVRVRIAPMQTKRMSFITAAGQTVDEVRATAARFAPPAIDRAFRESLREARRRVEQLSIEPTWLPQIQALGSLILNWHPALRAVPDRIDQHLFAQSDLWRYGISGDLPIVLLRMHGDEPDDLLDFLIRAQRLWAMNGLQADLVVLRMETAGYEEPLRERIHDILRDAHAYGFLGRPGGIHVVSAGAMPAAMRAGLEALAHIVLEEDGVPLATKLDRVLERFAELPFLTPTRAPAEDALAPVERPGRLDFDNGLGGFEPGTGDYLIHLEDGATTPAPWCNVLANDGFGTIVSEAGLGFTWAVNSGENRLTPWSNDPVTDEQGEALYLRDEETGAFWTVSPAPAGAGSACLVRHGVGRTVWRCNSHGLEQEMAALVPTDDPVKIVRIRLANRSGRPRRVTATYYAQWLLGALGSRSAPHTVCEYDVTARAVMARNGWNEEFSDRIAFLVSTESPHSVTGSRRDFLGPEGNARDPLGMHHSDLGGRFLPGGDACAAYQVHLDIAPGETTEVAFMLGQAEDIEAARAVIERWRTMERVEEGARAVSEHWDGMLGALTVKTPDPAFDLITNRWLVYQAVSSRLMARAGFYQAGGAFGFRDQLQDVLAVLHCDPDRARAQILNAAAHQFEEGDAQHWWHPPSGRGVRTRCSDDYIWLPFVTARYVEATGDAAILDAMVPFLSAPPLRDDEGDRYALFEKGETATLYAHCARALDHMMSTGPHGLPLIGAGDWNDGMDRVGDEGRGESVWLAWFQIATIDRFVPLAAERGDSHGADRWRRHARTLKKAADTHAWDGDWYVRAFDDDGEPWGSHRNEECRIDSIAQSWAVICGAGDRARAERAVRSANERLIRRKDRLVQLLDPPFHDTPRDPGYIRAYPPGTRENGGQYTHAATWLGLANAALGDGDTAHAIFDIINPIRRATDPEGAALYAREPYAVPGDVTGPGGVVGQGGWSWYTGAAGWTWQLAVTAILGISLKAGTVTIAPCLPKDWGWAEVTIAGDDGRLEIRIDDPDHLGSGELSVCVDGKPRKRHVVRLPGAGRTRSVHVRIGAARTASSARPVERQSK